MRGRVRGRVRGHITGFEAVYVTQIEYYKLWVEFT